MGIEQLKNGVALVTGGSNGIGAAVARRLRTSGVSVVLADIDEAVGNEVAADLGATFVRCDVREPDDLAAAVGTAVSTYGRLDLVHLNAGVTTGCGVGDDFDVALYRRAMAINLDGVVFGIHAALPALLAGGGGQIVATASMAGIVTPPLDPIYVANKHAVVGLVRSLAAEYESQGIAINALCPSFADTYIIEGIRSYLEETHFPILEVSEVVDAFFSIIAAGRTGECWYVVPGRDSEPFRFRHAPGPRSV
ncbi:MAG TPA: SDR family NAD(P)-dependent oxidoreductase [Acidimicrobiales bacterium]|jgi:NAD(P)-dependent dehydrogenase (short-subunit alcohol dehydrogenase family)|nr:SDR family NAD(P)-dependent oxidoreductase [Acidimicrobiales bacterium]